MFRSLLLAVVTAACLASTARADLILLDNTSNLTSWNTTSSSNFSGNYQANAKLVGMTFATGSSNYDLGSISVAMAYTGSGSHSPTIRLSLFQNASASDTKPADGATATYYQDFSGLTFNSTQQIYTFSPSTTWHLNPNTSYSFWLGTSSDMSSSANLRWYVASSSATSTAGFTQKGGFYTANGGASYSAGQALSMQITGTAVPEIDPAGMGSVLALVTGMLGLLERRRTIAA